MKGIFIDYNTVESKKRNEDILESFSTKCNPPCIL